MTAAVSQEGLLDRFPALRRLGASEGRGRIPFVQQLTASECAAACLAMTLGYHGKEVGLEEVRGVLPSGRDGTSALVLLEAAKHFGLRGRGVRIEPGDLEYVDPGSILHWELNHYVVFESARRGSVRIVDPAYGRREVSREEFGRAFTGVAVLLEPSEDFVPRTSGRATVWHHLRALVAGSPLLSRMIVASALLQVFSLAVPALTGAVVDRVVPRGDGQLLLVLGAGTVGLIVFQFLASLVRSHLLLRLRTLLDARMSLGYLEHLVALPYAFLSQRSAGDLMMRLNSNAVVRETLSSAALSGALDGLLVVLYLGILSVASWKMALLVVVLAGLQVLLFATTQRKQRQLMAESLGFESKTQAYQVELFTGLETLKSMGAEQHAVSRWSDLFVDVLNSSLRRGQLDALIEASMGALRLGSPLLLLGAGAALVMTGELSLGGMLGLNALAAGFLLPLGSLMGTATQLLRVTSYIDRLDDIVRAPREQDGGATRPAGRLSGRIELDRVSFRYGALSPLAVTGASVSIEPGQRVAIVGRSGAGKTTLARLLLALYRPDSGRILFDGEDLAQLDLGSVRRQIGVVPQSPALFGNTVRHNIALGDPEVDLSAVVEAAKLAGVHDEIAAMPMGYETVLFDRGLSLSGGQRQRIALARALVRKPSILLLDEATSALDSVTEAHVHRALSSLRCTRIVIAHRLSTIVSSDLILVMDQGALVERGTHQELLDRQGLYARLISAQLAG